MTRLLVTGASGMLGANLALLAQNMGCEVVGWTNSRPLASAPFATRPVDFCDQQALAQAFEAAQPNALINCAAQANVDAAEKHPEHAFRINAKAAGELAQMARAANVPMIQVSTDAVFDGTQGDYKENDAPNPLNTYAKSKTAMRGCSILKGFQQKAKAFPCLIMGETQQAEHFFLQVTRVNANRA